MIDLNKAKRKQQQEFLGWLTEELRIQPVPDKKTGKVGINALKYKDKLLNYAGDYQKGERAMAEEELLAILQNRENTGRYYGMLRQPLTMFLPVIRERYAQSLQAVLPLKEQLRLTDWLIDRIVYRLYDLNDEEIAVVEGR